MNCIFISFFVDCQEYQKEEVRRRCWGGWRFNKTVRLSIPNVCKVVDLLKDPHIILVQLAGFGIFFQVESEEERVSCAYVQVDGKDQP